MRGYTPPPQPAPLSFPLKFASQLPTPILCHLENCYDQVDVIFPKMMIDLITKVLKTQ